MGSRTKVPPIYRGKGPKFRVDNPPKNCRKLANYCRKLKKNCRKLEENCRKLLENLSFPLESPLFFENLGGKNCRKLGEFSTIVENL
jgi:hypothetical protein